MKRLLVYEAVVDVDGINNHYPSFSELLME